MGDRVAPLRVDFGVVNYNGGTAVVECVRSILEQEGPECRVHVFDNASTDGSAAAVREAFAGVRVVESGRNLGYAGALNRLLAVMDAPVVVLCNMDLTFDAGWAEAVVEALEAAPEAGAVSTLVLESTDPPVVNSLGVRFFADLHAQNVGSGTPYDPDAPPGAGGSGVAAGFGAYGAVMCFRREAVAELDFDEDYFLFFEETDFFLRYHLSGGRTTFAPNAVARHRRSLSTRRYSPLKLYYGERNRLTTVFKLLPVWYWPIAAFQTLRRMLVLGRSIRTGHERPEESAASEATPGQRSEAGATGAAMPSTAMIVWTLARAWTGAVTRLPGTLRKRRRFWKGAPATPADALAVVRRYALPASELRLR